MKRRHAIQALPLPLPLLPSTALGSPLCYTLQQWLGGISLGEYPIHRGVVEHGMGQTGCKTYATVACYVRERDRFDLLDPWVTS